MFTMRTREHAEAISDSKREASRIEDQAHAIGRPNRLALKNGIHNIQMIRLHENISSFGVFMAEQREAGDKAVRFGLYVRSTRESEQDLYDKLRCATDVGLVPTGISTVHVVKSTWYDTVTKYLERSGAESLCEWIFDSTGRNEEKCSIKHDTFRRVKLVGSEWWGADHYLEFNEDSVEYDHERASVARGQYNLAAMEYGRAYHSDLRGGLMCRSTEITEFLSKNPEYVDVISCGHIDSSSFDIGLFGFPDDLGVEYYRGEVDLKVNGSYNAPYEYPDTRAFAFRESRAIRKFITNEEKSYQKLRDIYSIWERYVSRSGDEAVSKRWEQVRNSDCKTNVARMRKLAEETGFDSAVEAYYSGVPLDDLIA